MKEHQDRKPDNLIVWRLFLLLFMLLFLGGFTVAAASLPAVTDSLPADSLRMHFEPVTITGDRVRALTGLRTDQLYVYVFNDGWQQIAAQVDEVTFTGAYTSTEDGRLDTNDEIVFMARDLGQQAPPTLPITAALSISPGWYAVEVTDPLSPTQTGWAYVVHSETLTPTVEKDYVHFYGGFHRIIAEDYALGFGVMHTGADYLTIGDGPEIMDRTKIRIECNVPVICPITEENLDPQPDRLIADGPVRVIVRGGEVQAYASMLRWQTKFDLPYYLWGSVRFSTDFNSIVSGSLLYNEVITNGVTIDGTPDPIPASPLSSWWQLNTFSSTLVYLADSSSIGGIQYNYYVDDMAYDESDSGDRKHFGETGIRVEIPNLLFTYTVSLYSLPDQQPNIGERIATWPDYPLSVVTELYGDPRPVKVYFPFLGSRVP